MNMMDCIAVFVFVVVAVPLGCFLVPLGVLIMDAGDRFWSRLFRREEIEWDETMKKFADEAGRIFGRNR
jgi:hypothetical protein